MKILFVSPHINPFKPTQGASQRSNLLLQAFTKIASVDVISFMTQNESDTDSYRIVYQNIIKPQNREGRLAKFKRLLTPWKIDSVFPVCSEWERIIDEIVKQNRYDYIVVRYVHIAVACGLMKYADKLVIDVDDNPIDVATISSKSAKTLRNKLYYKLMEYSLRFTMALLKKQVKHLFYSNAIQARINSATYLPNVPFYAIDAKQVAETHIKRGRIMFIGDMNYSPNIKGTDLFIENVYPKIKSKLPHASFHIVGSISDENMKEKWTQMGAVVTGFVESIVKEYAEAECIIVPIYSGGGTCIKILEAMQMQRPIVTTTLGFRGYGDFFKCGTDLMVVDNDDTFADAVIEILENKDFWKNLVNNAAMHYEKFFSKECFFEIVKKEIA